MKINLDQNESDALEQFEKSGANSVAVIRKIFEAGIDELKDVENIDPKGNMGLQSLARQEAVKIVRGLRDIIFPELAKKETKPGEPKKNPWR